MRHDPFSRQEVFSKIIYEFAVSRNHSCSKRRSSSHCFFWCVFCCPDAKIRSTDQDLNLQKTSTNEDSARPSVCIQTTAHHSNLTSQVPISSCPATLNQILDHLCVPCAQKQFEKIANSSAAVAVNRNHIFDVSIQKRNQPSPVGCVHIAYLPSYLFAMYET